MAKINVESGGAAPLNSGVLQLNNGVAMSSTLTEVTDQANTASPLKLSTTAVQVVSPLRVTTDDPSDMYLDLEDGSANNRFNITRNTASQQVNLNFASNPGGSTTTVGAIRTFTDGVNLGEVVKFREDGQVTFTERVNVEADSLVTTQSSSVIAASTTNANLVIAPNGLGALVASIPNGTATGGNARGVNAVDLQISRANANEVASGQQSVIVGGYNNRASGIFSMAGGGQNIATNQYALCLGGGFNTSSGGFSTVTGGSGNTASSNFATVSGGESNTASSGSWSTVGGGSTNTASSQYSTVSGGQSNTASTNTHATVVGGLQNTSSGQYSVSGGYVNVASGTGGVALGGGANAIGTYSLATGTNTFAKGTFSQSSGNWSEAYLYGQTATQSGRFNGQSDAQSSSLIARIEATLTTGGTTTLSLDGTGTTNLIIPSGQTRSWNVQVRWVAVVTAITGTATGVTVGDTKTSTDLLAVARRSGTTTVSAHTSAGTHAIETIAGSLTAANIAYTAGASQEMAITFTGPTFAGGGSVTMRVVAAISLTEVAY